MVRGAIGGGEGVMAAAASRGRTQDAAEVGGGASAEGACVGRLHLCTELVARREASGRVGPESGVRTLTH